MTMSRPLSREEFIAMGELVKARRQLLVLMFSGTQLKFGTMESLQAGRKPLQSGKKVYSSANKLGSAGGAAGKTATAAAAAIRAAAEDFIKECAGVADLDDVIAAITSEALNELISEMTPFIGVAMGGVKLAKAAKTVADDAYNLYKSDSYLQGFRPGDPLAAATAVQTIIKADLARHSIDLARHATATGAKIAGLFADLGTATTAGIGLANALAAIGLQLADLGMDIRQMKAGNARLAKPDSLSLDVFNESPILGCYLLTCADTSAVANMFVADIGLPGWMTKAEGMKKTQMDPMLKIAAKAISKSRLQLDGLRSNKGVHMEKSFFSKLKSKAIRKLVPA